MTFHFVSQVAVHLSATNVDSGNEAGGATLGVALCGQFCDKVCRRTGCVTSEKAKGDFRELGSRCGDVYMAFRAGLHRSL